MICACEDECTPMAKVYGNINGKLHIGTSQCACPQRTKSTLHRLHLIEKKGIRQLIIRSSDERKSGPIFEAKQKITM